MGAQTDRSPVITLVGAGGMAFGPTMVNDVIHTPELAGARLMLHDVDSARLDRAYRLAVRLNSASRAPIVIDRTTDPAAALMGADYVLSSAEFRRFHYRRQDYEVPNRYGARQINGENGGPGAVFHSLRSITNTMSICASIEEYCPDALLINLSNPLSRVALAINSATNLRNVSMCHEMPNGILRLAAYLRVPAADIEATASGINHFTFFTSMRDRRTGEDLLPRVRDLFERRVFDYGPAARRVVRAAGRFGPTGALADEFYMPVVVHLVRRYGLVPCSIDSHIGEYLPFAPDCAPWFPSRAEVMERLSRFGERSTDWLSTTRLPVPLHRRGRSAEEVIPIIAANWTGARRELMAVNVPNRGHIPNLPDGAIVEVGATVDGDGVHPHAVAPLAEPIVEWTLPQLELQQLVLRSALERDPDLAFEALRRDPLSPADERACRAMFDELRRLQADHLPF